VLDVTDKPHLDAGRLLGGGSASSSFLKPMNWAV
jgi:hypothetical protein